MRPLQQDHASLATSARCCEQLAARAACRPNPRRRQRRRAAAPPQPAGSSSGGGRARPAAAAAAPPPAASSLQLGQELGEQLALAGQQAPSRLNPALARDDADVVDFLFRQVTWAR